MPDDIFDQIHRNAQGNAAPDTTASTPPATPAPTGDIFDQIHRTTPSTPTPTAAQPKGPSAPQTAAEQYGITSPWLAAPVNLVQGIGAGVMSTARGLSQIAHRAVPAIPEIPESYATAPDNPVSQAGKVLEQGAEFLAPSELVSGGEKLIEGATQVPRLIRAGAKLLPEAVSAAGVTGAQTGGDLDAMQAAALLAGGTKFALPLLGKAGAKVLGTSTGAGAKAVEAAAQGSPEFTQAMRGGVTEQDILQHLKNGMQGVKDQRGAAYQAQLAKIPSNLRLDLTPVRNEMANSLHNLNIRTGVGPNGQTVLDFSRSAIRDPTAQNEVLGIVNDINDWGSQPGDLTPTGVDTLKRRIDDVYSPSSNARAFVTRLKNQTRGILNSQVPGYQQMTADYAKASDFLDNLKDLSLNATNDGTAIRKFNNLMGRNDRFRQELVNQLSQYAGRNLPAEIAGKAMSGWIPGKIGGLGDAMLGLLGFGHIVPWGPAIGAMAASSPRLVGETAKVAGQVAPFVPKAAGAIPRAIYVDPDRYQYMRQAEGGRVDDDPLRRLPDRAAILRSLISQ